MKTMQIVGITGRSGSGKSRVMGYYESLGYPVIHGDAVAREIVQPGQPVLADLAEAFGADILAEDGTLRRGELAKRTFGDAQKNQLLIDITHPHILRVMLEDAEAAAAAGHELFFLDGAMIIGYLVEPYCDRIVVVSAPEEQLVRRIMARDGIDEVAARQRLDAQLSDEEMREAADYVLHNDGTEEQLLKRADRLLNTLKQGA